MEDLVQWLGAQLDEDERIAYGADDSIGKMNLDWKYQPEDELGGKVVSARGADLIYDVAMGVGRHVAEYSPRRVLREIDAKRRILCALETAEVALRNTEPGKEPRELMTGATNSLRAAARMLAAAYTDRPGYREEWRP